MEFRYKSISLLENDKHDPLLHVWTVLSATFITSIHKDPFSKTYVHKDMWEQKGAKGNQILLGRIIMEFCVRSSTAKVHLTVTKVRRACDQVRCLTPHREPTRSRKCTKQGISCSWAPDQTACSILLTGLLLLWRSIFHIREINWNWLH